MTLHRSIPGVAEARAWLNTFESVHLDLGTGDGAYAVHTAQMNPATAVLGIDTCLDNLTKVARRERPNLRFVTCDATTVPASLCGIATSLSINFPFGSLLRAVVTADVAIQRRLFASARPNARIEIRVNTPATTNLGLTKDDVEARLRQALSAVPMSAVLVTSQPQDLYRRFPSTWAKRLGHGKPSHVVVATCVLGTGPITEGWRDATLLSSDATGDRQARLWQ